MRAAIARLFCAVDVFEPGEREPDDEEPPRGRAGVDLPIERLDRSLRDSLPQVAIDDQRTKGARAARAIHGAGTAVSGMSCWFVPRMMPVGPRVISSSPPSAESTVTT